MHPAHCPAPTAVLDSTRHGTLLDIWGDTVSARHLARALVISMLFAIGAFYGGTVAGSRLIAEPQIASAVSLGAGLLGCIAAGVTVAVLFEPKRTLVKEVADSTSRSEAMAILASEQGGLGSFADLDTGTAEEIRRLGLADLFDRGEQSLHRTKSVDEGDPQPAEAP